MKISLESTSGNKTTSIEVNLEPLVKGVQRAVVAAGSFFKGMVSKTTTKVS